MDYKYLNYNHSLSDNEVTFICPKCLRTLKTKINSSIDFNVDSNQNMKGIEMVIDPIPVTLSCEKCEELMFICDSKLVDRVIELNKRGFTTLYCCEGHIDCLGSIDVSDMTPVYNVATPYIGFDYSKLSDTRLEVLSIIMHKYASEDKIYVSENNIDAVFVYPTGINEDIDPLSLEEKEKIMDEARNKLFEFIDCLIQSTIITNFKLEVAGSEVMLNKADYRNLAIQ